MNVIGGSPVSRTAEATPKQRKRSLEKKSALLIHYRRTRAAPANMVKET
jgi:hypothetical protein